MNNEETTIMQPNNEQGNEPQNQSANPETQKKSNTGQRAAATVGAAVLGGVAGAGGMYAAEHMMNDKEDPETKDPETKETETKETETKEEPTASASKTNDGNQDGPDYTGHNGANPTTPNPGVHQTNNGGATSNSGSDNAQVIDIQHIQGPNGEDGEAVILTDGERIAAVVDADGDGKADLFALDENKNGQFENNEIHDVRSDNVSMSGFEQAYSGQPHGHQTGNDSGSGTNEVQVLGVYQTEGESGQTVETAVLTNGQEVAAVVDVDGDRYAEALWVDNNHNRQIDEGEVYDVSGEQVHMSGYEQQYLAQQQQEQQQDTYYSSDEQSDYDNGIDAVQC